MLNEKPITDYPMFYEVPELEKLDNESPACDPEICELCRTYFSEMLVRIPQDGFARIWRMRYINDIADDRDFAIEGAKSRGFQIVDAPYVPSGSNRRLADIMREVKVRVRQRQNPIDPE